MYKFKLKIFFLFTVFLIQISGASDYIASLGLTSLPPVLVVATSNTMPVGLQTLDGISLNDDNRVLLTAQTVQTQNGIWVVHPGNWTRPADFAAGSQAGNAFVLAISGDEGTSSNWICNTPNALIGTDTITFVEVHLSNQITLANVGSGVGRVFQDQIDTRFNLKTIAAGSHMAVTNNVDNIELSTDASDLNNPGAIVSRDALGNFSAGTINANLIGNVIGNLTGSVTGSVTGNLAGNLTGNLTGNVTGNATTADTAVNFSGMLFGDVVGGQSSTSVSAVGGQSSDSVALATTIVNAATNLNTASTLVKRDSAGNFTTNKINISGEVVNPTDAATKAYVDAVAALGLEPHTPAVVVATSNIVLSGLQAVDGVALIDGDRVLAVAQSDGTTNGLWVVRSDVWTRPTDFSVGTEIGADYILILGGVANIGSSWLCNSTTAVVGTDPISFVQFSLPSQTTANNVGTGNGRLFKDKTGVTLNLKTISAGLHTVVTNNTDDVGIATDATNINAANTIVARDGLGNFAAGTITANLAGNAITATTATNFSGSLVGDVTGTQGATVVSTVGGQIAANVASATIAANSATNNNTFNTIVKRGSSGGFSAGIITATNFSGNVTGNVTGNVSGSAASFTGSLVGDVAGTQGATVVSAVGGQTAANVASATTSANAATNVNTASTIVKRDSLGNFAAGTITANLVGNVTGNVSGNATTATSATSATTATNFTGSLIGDVIGTQGATVVGSVGGQTAVNIASATTAANAATNLNTVSTIVKRDTAGNFAAGTISANLVGNVTGNVSGNATTATSATTATTATNFSGSLVGDVTGMQGATVVSNVGGQSAVNVASATTAANAATNVNTVSTIVKRDSSGNFATNMITINGTATNPTDVATKGYVDAVAALGINPHPSALVVGTSNIALSGLQVVDGISLVANNRILLVSQAVASQNGLWLVQPGAWTRPTDFAVNTEAGQAYVLITEGALYDGSSWICSTPTSTIGTDGITFVEFSLPSQTTGVNVGGGVGQLFQGQNGVTLNFKTVAAGTHLLVANNANDITLSTDATSSNMVGSIVSRDSSGNFAAGTITANLVGNVTGNVSGNATTATSATSATTATTATNFSGSLVGDVTGTQGATVVSAVGGQTAANVASATTTANAATNLNTASTIVKRDSSGSFAAGTITANLVGNVTGNVSGNATTATSATSATTATTATNFSGSLAGDVTGTQGATVVSGVGGQTAANVASATTAANAATSVNTASVIVKRDSSGNFAAGTITANLVGNVTGNVSGNATTATSATTATTATNFSGSLAGNVTGTQGATIVSTVGGQTAANVASATTAANAATNVNTSSTIVKRDSSGNFVAGTITANLIGNVTGNVSGNATTATSATSATTATTATNFSGSLIGDVTGTQGATVVSTVGGQTAVNVALAVVAANAATDVNIANTIVERDALGNFAAGTITANLIGNASGSASLNVLKAGDTMTGALQLPNGTAASPALNFAGSTTTGISAAVANTLSFDTSGVERMNINTTSINAAAKLVLLNLLCDQAVQLVTPTNNGSVTAATNTSLLLLKNSSNVTNYTINFPSSPTDGQFFTIMLGTTNTITINNSASGGATVVNGITSLSPAALAATTGGTSVTYMYNSAANAWYRYNRG